jgi:hypothetical protein
MRYPHSGTTGTIPRLRSFLSAVIAAGRSSQSDEETKMSSAAHPIMSPGVVARSLAAAALMGATILAASLSMARAETAGSADSRLAQAAPSHSTVAPGGAIGSASRGETIEQRISSLRVALRITPDEETKWNAVAQAMRDNAAAMEKLVAESHNNPTQNMTALEDLKLYQRFAQAHVDGLQNLISSFSTLYDAMPASQKKVADEVFEASRMNARAQASRGQAG